MCPQPIHPYISKSAALVTEAYWGSGKSSTHPQSKFTATQHVLPCLIWLARVGRPHHATPSRVEYAGIHEQLRTEAAIHCGAINQYPAVDHGHKQEVKLKMHCWVVDVKRVVAHSNSKGHAPLPGVVRTAVLCSGKQATSAVSLSGCTWTNRHPEMALEEVVRCGAEPGES